MDTRTRASRIKLIAFDIDGVMTDGGLHYTDDGHELKTFNVQDGLGLKLLQRAGLELAIVTGRTSGVVAARAADLGIEHVFQGVVDKHAVVASLLEKLGLLTHPHTSAGRIPTELGFRFLVRHLLAEPALLPIEQDAIRSQFSQARRLACGKHDGVPGIVEFDQFGCNIFGLAGKTRQAAGRRHESATPSARGGAARTRAAG